MERVGGSTSHSRRPLWGGEAYFQRLSTYVLTDVTGPNYAAVVLAGPLPSPVIGPAVVAASTAAGRDGNLTARLWPHRI
jgi:hypothetical protein